MAYDKHVWQCGEAITTEKLNHMEDGIASGGGGGASMESVTYSELKAMRDGGNLTPGAQYRITDYICTTTQGDSRVVSNPFDIIVVADDENTLNENARACLHEGDAYYSASNHSADLSAWELKYSIDNDTDRFGWADATNGKGVIFWLKDEKNNECPYDFKQIQFSRDNGGTTNWYYTFSVRDFGAEEVVSNDASVSPLDGTGCQTYGNVIRPFYGEGYHYDEGIMWLNMITFDNDYSSACYSNIFENGCYDNTFGDACNSNIFGNYCYGNTFGNYCVYIDFFQNATTQNNRYYHVLDGTQGASSSRLAINGTNANNFVTYVGKNSNGTLKTWVPADAVA